MKHLWSPWRMKYIEGSERKPGCIFCMAVQAEDSAENLIVQRGEHAFVILNRYPYTNGHLMVVPYAHLPSIELLETAVRGELMELISLSMEVLRKEYRPPAFNLGANIGVAAGAGVAAHVHFHVVPRWPGDTNFISVVGDVRVLPEELADTWQRLKERFAD